MAKKTKAGRRVEAPSPGEVRQRLNHTQPKGADFDEVQWFTGIRSAMSKLAETMKPSDHLQMLAEVGASMRALGPIEDNFEDAVNRWASMGISIADPSRYDDQEAFREQMHPLHTAGRWAQYGYNTFGLTDDLAATFLLTDPPPVPEEGLALPFPVFIVRIPRGIVPMFIRDKQTWADLIVVHQFTGRHRIHGVTKFLRVSAYRGTLQVWRDRFPSEIAKDEDESIFNRVAYDDPPYVPEDSLSCAAAVRIVRNLVSWLDSTGGMVGQEKPVPPRKKKSKKSQQKLASGVYPRVWFIGKDVKIRPELRAVARDVALGGSKRHAPEGWKVRVRHTVRGHWKRQAHGEGMKLRKLIRVEPYWRGPEGEAAWAHIYKDEGSKGDD